MRYSPFAFFRRRDIFSQRQRRSSLPAGRDSLCPKASTKLPRMQNQARRRDGPEERAGELQMT